MLQRTYEALHPGLYRYNTPQQMREHFALLRRSLDHDQPLDDVYLAFSEFAATVRCGHTYANFFNQSDATRAQLFERADRVPFYFRWLDGRMIVTRNLSPEVSLSPGTEIIAINGISAQTILARLMLVARADGSNDAKRIASLEVLGNEKIETFDVFLPLFFPDIGSRQVLTVRAPNETRTRRLTVTVQTYSERFAARPAKSSSESPWTLDTSNARFAVLRMPTWALYDSAWDWHGFLDQTFNVLNEHAYEALVIDLRGNEGGLDVGDVVLAHLVETDLPLSGYLRLVRYRKVPDELLPNLRTWDPSFKDWGDKAVPWNDRFYRLARYDDDSAGTVIHPATPHFSGKVFILVGATNSSATFEFAQRMKEKHLGILVGQTTGGNQRGINGGAFFFLTLPNSGIERDVPLIGRFPRDGVTADDAGVAPDVPVPITAADIAAGTDVELTAVKTLVK
ncbi:MAG: S41 family peptidase [Rudaea sp.]|nr:S41 family peptidase [Rudaea sp.]